MNSYIGLKIFQLVEISTLTVEIKDYEKAVAIFKLLKYSSAQVQRFCHFRQKYMCLLILNCRPFDYFQVLLY